MRCCQIGDRQVNVFVLLSMFMFVNVCALKYVCFLFWALACPFMNVRALATHLTLAGRIPNTSLKKHGNMYG